VFTPYQLVGASETVLTDISDSGLGVGAFVQSGRTLGFKSAADGVVVLDTGADVTYAAGVNDRGEIVGGLTTFDGTSLAFIWRSGSFSYFDFANSTNSFASDINNRSQIVGSYVDANNTTTGFLYDKGHFTKIRMPGSAFTVAVAINDLGQIIGRSDLGAFMYWNGNYSLLSTPEGGIETYVIGINDLGQVVGFYSTGLQFVPFQGRVEPIRKR